MLSDATVSKANELAKEVQSEAITMLKNDDSNLPLSNKKVNVFGWGSTNPVYGGTGSGSMSDQYDTVSLLDGMKEAGIETNADLTKLYTDYRADRAVVGMWAQDWTLPEVPADQYSDSLISDAKSFSDEAVVVITRVGGEGADLPTNMKAETITYENNSNDYEDFQDGEHFLQLSKADVLHRFGKAFHALAHLPASGIIPLQNGYADVGCLGGGIQHRRILLAIAIQVLQHKGRKQLALNGIFQLGALTQPVVQGSLQRTVIAGKLRGTQQLLYLCLFVGRQHCLTAAQQNAQQRAQHQPQPVGSVHTGQPPSGHKKLFSVYHTLRTQKRGWAYLALARGTILNARRVALRIVSGKIIFICSFETPAGVSKLLFHGRGRNKKRQPPRSFPTETVARHGRLLWICVHICAAAFGRERILPAVPPLP